MSINTQIKRNRKANETMKPVIKWAGGKTQLLHHIITMLPTQYNNYFEPFIGGGAVLFHISPASAMINDVNSELINMYTQIKKRPTKVISYLSVLDKGHEQSRDPKSYYYHIRHLYNENLGTHSPEQASRLIYLNKHCFNGLYRVNSKGFFNVPFNNKKAGNSFDKQNILEISKYLRSVRIRNVDFERAVKNAKKGDFVFFDSPYAPLNPTSFTDYTKDGFHYEDHLRLANLFKKLTNKGVYCMLTNHNTPLINELYKDFEQKIVPVSRSINSKATKRKGEEIIIINYDISNTNDNPI